MKASNSSSTARWMISLAPTGRAPRAAPPHRRALRRRAARRSSGLSPPTAVRFFSRRRSPFLVLQDFGEPTPSLLRSPAIYSSWETRPDGYVLGGIEPLGPRHRRTGA